MEARIRFEDLAQKEQHTITHYKYHGGTLEPIFKDQRPQNGKVALGDPNLDEKQTSSTQALSNVTLTTRPVISQKPGQDPGLGGQLDRLQGPVQV